MEAVNQNTTETNRDRRERAPEPAREAWVAPPVDILESESDLLFVADVPGVRAEDLTVELDKGVLTFVGRVPAKEGRSRWAYRRSFALPRDFDGDAITAALEAGVLELRVPRRGSAKRRQIPVRGA